MGKLRMKQLILIVIIMSLFIWLVDGLLDFGNKKFHWEEQSAYYKWESLDNVVQASPNKLGEFYFQVAKVEALEEPKGITVYLIVANMSNAEKKLTHYLTLKGPEDSYEMSYEAYPSILLAPKESRNLELVFDIGKEVDLEKHTIEIKQEGHQEKLELSLNSFKQQNNE